jgi:hypothetical protein
MATVAARILRGSPILRVIRVTHAHRGLDSVLSLADRAVISLVVS